jgi:site-specific DNA-methyltransferase (adenine-specific)
MPCVRVRPLEGAQRYLESLFEPDEPNRLYYGDNLDVLRRHVKDETVDLVYLDPPFKSNQDYNVLFAEHGTKSAAQIKAFEDTWTWDLVAESLYVETVESGGEVGRALRAFRDLLGTSDMLAYLAMMAPRLVELHRVLRITGSLYLHCDPAASHYLKLLLDAIFGPTNFRNEIIWKRTTAHSSAKRYAPIHDVVLYYGKAPKPKWNAPRAPYDEGYLERYYRFDDGDGRLYWRADLCAAGVRKGSSGKPWRGFDPSKKGMHWKFTVERLDELDAQGRIYWPPGGTGWPQYKRYREELKGKAIPDIWTDIDRINPVGNERLGYPTQKPEALLERIIVASSNESDVVLDPFCGCGTTIAAAQQLKRRWVGIDITHLAINLIKHRLQDAYGPEIEKTYEVVGEPVTLDDAAELARSDPYQFQWWALGLVGARPADPKKGADKGVDGRLFFHDEHGGKTKQIVLSVKAGRTGSGHVDQLRGVVGKEDAAIGVLISFQEPTKPMRENAASAGFYSSPGWGTKHPRIQLVTVRELLEGRLLDYPHMAGATYKKAPKAKPSVEQIPMDLLGQGQASAPQQPHRTKRS